MEYGVDKVRNISGFFQRSYSIYSRMDKGNSCNGPSIPPLKVTARGSLLMYRNLIWKLPVLKNTNQEGQSRLLTWNCRPKTMAICSYTRLPSERRARTGPADTGASRRQAHPPRGYTVGASRITNILAPCSEYSHSLLSYTSNLPQHCIGNYFDSSR